MVAALIKVIYSGAEDVRLGTRKEVVQRLHPYIAQYKAPRQGRATTQLVRLDFISTPDFGKSVSAVIPRKGHFVRRIFLVTTPPNLDEDRVTLGADAPQFGYTNSIGHALIGEASIDIGGAHIDTLNGRLMEVLDERYTPLEKVPTVNRLIGRTDQEIADGIPSQTLHIPLPFWFSSNDTAAALPIDAISRDEVRLNITFDTLANIYYTESRNPDTQGLYTIDSPTYYKYSTDDTGELHPEISLLEDYYGTKLVQAGKGRPIAEHHLGDTYILAEYVYVDAPEANRFRMADLNIPLKQHVIMQPVATEGRSEVQIPLRIGNPVANIHFFLQNVAATTYNHPFLATREISPAMIANQPSPVIWQPRAIGLSDSWTGTLRPGFLRANSEPIRGLTLRYHGQLIRYSSDFPVQYRTIMPLTHGGAQKTAWHWRYYYTLPFGESTANYDKIERVNLELRMAPRRGQLNTTSAENCMVYIFAETSNILRIFGGRAGLLF